MKYAYIVVIEVDDPKSGGEYIHQKFESQRRQWGKSREAFQCRRVTLAKLKELKYLGLIQGLPMVKLPKDKRDLKKWAKEFKSV